MQFKRWRVLDVVGQLEVGSLLRRGLRTAIASVVGLVVAFGVLVPSAEADTLVSLPLQVDFQDAASTPASGYAADSGAAYDATRGYGWVNESTGVPLSIVGNGRARNVLADKRLDTFIHMQLPADADGVATNAAWKASVPNGAYSITVAAGDPSYTDSHNVIRVEGLTVLDFVPNTAAPQQTSTATVNVTDGVLNVDAIGGVNTKLDYITITATTSSTPTIISVDPNNGTTNNFRDTQITVRTSNGIGAGTANATSFKVLDANNNPVAGFYNVDGAYSNASFQPSALLNANATYQVQVNSNLKDTAGNSYAPFTSTFTTGSAVSTAAADVSFTTSTFDSSTTTPGPMAITKGPDGKLYVAYNNGDIFAYSLDANGNKTGAATEITAYKFSRTITGLTFDPQSTATNLILYVTNNQYGCDLSALGTACTNFTGKISRLTGTSASNLVSTDVITGLPRSVGDHQTNGTAFGPDGALYIAQGAQNGYGDLDSTWGNRGEDVLSAAILRADVRTITSAVNVNTSSPTNYNPKAAGAKVTLYTTGIRNPYSLVWASNGKLYAPVNESSNGNTPADPAGGASALTGLPAFDDYFTEVVQGKYYGHPNPARSEYRLNGANPTAGVDPFEVSQYPVGTQPNANYRTPDLDLGSHRSANGAAEFTSNVFGSTLQGQFLVTEYAGGKDVIAIKTDASGKPVSKTVVASGFNNPLPIYVDNTTGRVYVGEYGSDPKGEGGKITLLTPNGTTGGGTTTPPTTGTSWKINFGAQSTVAPTGYSADYGQAFDATRGYGWNTSLVGNGRERNVNSDKRLDSFVHMQLPAGADGVQATGTWDLAVPNGTYSLTIGVGDPSNTDSVDVIRAEGTQIVNYTPTAAAPQSTVTATVVVADGKLTIDPTGGTNTKIDYIDVALQSTSGGDGGTSTTTTLKVNFGAQTTAAPAGYTADYGQAYDATRGFGWEDASTGAATSLVGNGRERNLVADKRLDSFIHMQLGASSDGVKNVGKWEAALANGTYNVTVGVGDPGYTDSVNIIRAEGTQILSYTPTATVPQNTVTASVVVSDGKLTLDPIGGSNTKIDYVDIASATTAPPAQTDTTPPVVTINTSGTSAGTNSYYTAASVTILASDPGSGVAASGIKYTVTGPTGTSAQATYSAPFQISGVGTYTINATATDKATPVANTGTANKTITIVAPPTGGTAALTVTTPEDYLGLGSRLVFTSVKNDARTGHAATLKNTGTAAITVTGLSFTGTDASQFQLCSAQTLPFSLAVGATKDICVQYRPNVTFSGTTAKVSSANLVVANSSAVANYTITLGGVDTPAYEGDNEASLQDIFSAIGYKANVGMTYLPNAKSVSVTSDAVGDEVLAPYFLRNDTTKVVSMIPLAHYSGIDYPTSWKMGYFNKGNNSLVNLYNFQTGATNNGYGENQNLLPKITGTQTFTPSGAFGLGDTDGNRSDDAINPEGKFHNYRFYQAKKADGTVIPNSYIVGVDIGSPWNNSGKNWDYQDFAFLLTNVKIDTSVTQPKGGVVTKTYDFNGNDGGQLGTGFTAFQGTSTASDITLSGGRLNVKSSSDSNFAHKNALYSPVNLGTNTTIQARLVGPFTNINAGEEQQAIWFGPDATHYMKLEVENSGSANTVLLTFDVQNGLFNTAVKSISVPKTSTFVDFKFDIQPALDSGPKVTASYSLNGSSTFTVITSNYSLPTSYITPATPAGILQSHQGGGTQFTAIYENFAIRRS